MKLPKVKLQWKSFVQRKSEVVILNILTDIIKYLECVTIEYFLESLKVINVKKRQTFSPKHHRLIETNRDQACSVQCAAHRYKPYIQLCPDSRNNTLCVPSETCGFSDGGGEKTVCVCSLEVKVVMLSLLNVGVC